jgi:hypothetical protein
MSDMQDTVVRGSARAGRYGSRRPLRIPSQVESAAGVGAAVR